MLLHYVTQSPPTLGELGMPAVLVEALRQTQEDHGLIVISGRTGVGKSTTVAAGWRDHLERQDRARVMEYGPTQEFCYDAVVPSGARVMHEKGIAAHRDDGLEGCVRNALRRQPTVIVLGDLSDVAALNKIQHAAQSTCPVIATVQSGSLSGIFQYMEDASKPVDGLAHIHLSIEQKLSLTRREGQLHIRTDWTWVTWTPALRAGLLDSLQCKDMNARAHWSRQLHAAQQHAHHEAIWPLPSASPG